jgi:chromosome segregation ATPase
MGCASCKTKANGDSYDSPSNPIRQLRESPTASRRSRSRGAAIASNDGANDTVIIEEPTFDSATTDGKFNEDEVKCTASTSLKSQNVQELIGRLSEAEMQTIAVHQTSGHLTNAVMYLEGKVDQIVGGGNLKSEGGNSEGFEHSAVHDGNQELQQLDIFESAEQEFVSRLAVVENKVSVMDMDAERLRAPVQQPEDQIPQVVAVNSDLQSKCMESEKELVMLRTQLSSMHEKLAANEEKLKSFQEARYRIEEQLHIQTHVNASLKEDNTSLHKQLVSLRKR